MSNYPILCDIVRCLPSVDLQIKHTGHVVLRTLNK